MGGRRDRSCRYFNYLFMQGKRASRLLQYIIINRRTLGEKGG